MNHTGSLWQTETLTRTYLDGIRGAIPLAQAQIDVLRHVVEHWCAPSLLPPVQPTAGRWGTEGGAGRVLDLGCGDGILARTILDRFPNAQAVLVDFSEAMLQAAREKMGDDDRARIIQANFTSASWLTQLPNDAGTSGAAFDLVVSGFAIHHNAHERKKVLYAQVYDLLAPGGVFLNLEHVASPTPAVEALFDEHFIDHLCAYHRAKDPSASRDEISRTHYHRPDKAENILALVETQCDWLRQIGFQDVDCFFKVFELALFGGRKPV
jgi:ubiquinone/menaquinone biosynthesis C-methylase UbiE